MAGNKIFFYVAAFLLTFCHLAQGHEKKWPERRLRQAWPSAESFTSKQVALSPNQISDLKAEGIEIASNEKNPIFYLAQSKVAAPGSLQNLGAILFVDEPGDNGLMEISVAIGNDGQIKKIDIWESSENQLISKDDFLKQFVGKSSKDSFLTNKDFKPVEAAPKASIAVSKAAQKAIKISSLIFKKK